MAEFSVQKWNLSEIKRELYDVYNDCFTRRLTNNCSWTSELIYSLKDIQIEKSRSKYELIDDCCEENDQYILARSYFDQKEYDRASNLLRDSKSDIAYFLDVYSRFLSGEKKLLDQRPILNIGSGEENISHLKQLRSELKAKRREKTLDAYCLWLYGVVLTKLKLVDEAVEIFCDAIALKSAFWNAWEELSKLVTDSFMLTNLSIPTQHWMYTLFKAHVLSSLNLGPEAIELYIKIKEAGFNESTYITAEMGRTYNTMRDMESSCEQFKALIHKDPYRIEDMDIYSNVLYVQEKRQELAVLAQKLSSIDKYRPQTCCAIGNYYSIRGTHEKAALYFERTLKLDPNYADACTLLGHEYLNLKHFAGAIQAYRRGLDINRNDYRAWYGLGQAYELLHLHRYSLYYFMKAHSLRPNDFRAIIGLGVCYEALKRLEEAKKCYWKAHQVGDEEGLAIVRLAKVYENLGEDDNAAAAHVEFLNFTDNQLIVPSADSLAASYKYLSMYYLKHKNLKEAAKYAEKCTEFPQVREDGKFVQKQMALLVESGGLEGIEDTSMEQLPASITMQTPGMQSRDESICKEEDNSLCFTP